ncbi:MAG: division/cell wall cluster transcriptional repressor MraZ [Erysipelotrichaceae bacterium]|nr:division/cell wall cluster transcriptional repressor MraZ [Erysipelotrichaceae bacterium]MBP5279838.1 division/cell wall cluster transcriptional repressor MraZ [Erysipelotrichaceae bacterium]
MFIGEYQHNLDAKGRIIIPSRFRDELHNTFILTRGLDGCLTIYSLEQWEKMFVELNKLPTTKKDARSYLRMLTTRATECTLDAQGRIIIPSFLAKAVNIEKECVVVGVNDHIEIWDKKAWEDYYLEASNNFEEVAENLNELINNND